MTPLKRPHQNSAVVYKSSINNIKLAADFYAFIRRIVQQSETNQDVIKTALNYGF